MSQKKPTPADAGRLVRKAAEIIDDNGWTQGSLSKKDSAIRYGNSFNERKIITIEGMESYCISGAINKAYCGNPLLDRLRHKKIPLLDLSHKLLDEFLGTKVEAWNDGKAESKEEVLQYLRKFADEYDPQRV